MLSISFWKKDSGNMLTHAHGLTHEQIQELHEINIGDRLVLWQQSKDTETKPNYTLKKFIKKESLKEE